MYRILLVLFTLPPVVMLLLVGLIDTALAATPSATPRSPNAAPAASDFGLPEAAPAGAGTGGPYEPVASDASDSDPGGWRIAADPRAERRFAPPAQRPLNRITLRF